MDTRPEVRRQLENEFAGLTAQLKNMSITDPDYGTVWNKRGAIRLRLLAMGKNVTVVNKKK